MFGDIGTYVILALGAPFIVIELILLFTTLDWEDL